MSAGADRMGGEWRDMEVSELVHRVVPSPNCNDRALPVTMLVLHYTEMKPVETALDRLCDPDAGVSAHYLISEEGEVTLLVPEEKRQIQFPALAFRPSHKH